MSLLVKNLSPRQIFQLTRVLNAAQSKQCHWYPDYKPGPYPKTKEEWDAAAKKYNLLPEEYEPYPDDGFGSGDYPKLPFESVDSKDPYENYTQPQLRRNYKEPIHREIMILLPELLSTDPPKYTLLFAYSVFFGFLGTMFTFFYFGRKWRIEQPVLKKQYPEPGVKHYTFELKEKEEINETTSEEELISDTTQPEEHGNVTEGEPIKEEETKQGVC